MKGLGSRIRDQRSESLTLFGISRIGIFKGGNRVTDKTYLITVGKLKQKLPDYTLGQNIVISVYHKHEFCENNKNFVNKGLVEGDWAA